MVPRNLNDSTTATVLFMTESGERAGGVLLKSTILLNQHFSGPEVGQSHRLYCEKGPAEAVLPSPAEEVQPAYRSC